MNRRPHVEWLVFATLVVGGAWLRVAFRDLPNFAPVAALALFSGYFFRHRRMAVGVPLLVMGISDLWLGGYDLRVMATVYSMLAVPVFARDVLRAVFQLAPGRWSRAMAAVGGLVGCSLLSSVLFFLVTNFAVWCCYDYYATDSAGLVNCYVRALPFFRYTLAGDLCFSTLLFGAYSLAVTSSLVSTPAPRNQLPASEASA